VTGPSPIVALIGRERSPPLNIDVALLISVDSGKVVESVNSLGILYSMTL